MNPGYKPVPKLFWNRLLLLLIFITVAFLGQKLLHLPYFIDPSLTFSILAIGAVITWFLFFRVFENPFLTSLIPILYIFWLILDKFLSKTIHFSFKPHILALGFIVFAGLLIFHRNLKYLWSFMPARFFTVFAVINIVYYFVHSSNFNISLEGYMYGWTDSSEGKDAKTIILVDALLMILSFCVPSIMFVTMKSKEQLDSYINKLSYIFLFGFLAYFLLFPITARCLPTGKQVFLPLTFFFMLSLKVYIDNNFNKSNWFNFSYFSVLVATGVLVMFNSNKSAFLAFLGAVVFFIGLNFVYIKNKFKIIIFPKMKYLYPIVISFFFLSFLIVALKLNLFDLIFSKFEKTFSSISESSGVTSWYIRKSNWYYFFNNWKNKLDLFNFIFGFGIGASRESIFYITAMQYSRIYLVQTTHNQFFEMFYDYGLMCLLFYLPIIGILVKDLIMAVNKNAEQNIKVLSGVNAAMIIFFFIYNFSDGLRLQTVVILFTFLGFNEMMKHTIKKISTENYLVAQK